MAGVRNSSAGRPNRSTSWAAPPSTRTKAIPPFLPRLLSHLTEVPVKVNAAIAPRWVDSTAAPPLQPARGSLGDHAPLKLTAATSDSSTRSTAEAAVPAPPPFPGGVLVPAGGVLVPPGGALALELSPPPPPQETMMPASSQTPTHLM